MAGNIIRMAAAAGIFAMTTGPAAALDGMRDVFLEDTAGTRHRIATLDFTAARYAVRMNDALFSDHFLSMRPFRCLDGPDVVLCHVPYPYEIARQASPQDLTDLEYDFLFVWKPAGSYGIDLWNGVYYKLAPEAGRLVGRLHEVDLGMLAVPPETGERRPITSADLTEAEPGSHWLPRLVIE